MLRTGFALLATLACCVVATTVPADDIDVDDRVLYFDPALPPVGALRFQRDDDLDPDANDFRIINAFFMSNDLGERWALLTIENSASGQRLLKDEYLVATFANGSQAEAIGVEETVKAKERFTKTVFFGLHRFPIIQVRSE